jgi:N-acetylmuramoyl-L-alanine amidase
MMRKLTIPILSALAISTLTFIAKPPQVPTYANTIGNIGVEEVLISDTFMDTNTQYEPMNILEMIEHFEGDIVEELPVYDDHTQDENTNNINNTDTNNYKDYTKEDLHWLAKIISAEAKGEPSKGQVAVGNVVLNRVESEEFPNTIKDVIFQKNQFSPVKNGSIHKEPTEEAVESAKKVLEGKRVVSEEVMYFYNHKISRGSWIRSRKVVKQIGNHNFAK